MDAIGIDFAALLPAFMRAQDDDAAMAAALSPVLRARALQLASLGIADFLCDADAPLTDAQASTLLDSLASYMGLEWWRADWATATKRGMMSQAEKLRQLSESKWALETILRVYFSDPALTVEEWWEYGGAPYCFRVLTSNAEAQAALRFKNVVELIKRQSQQWEGLWAGFSCRGVIYRGALGTDDTRLTGEAVLYRYLPAGTAVDGADGLAALSAILTAANPGQDVTDVLDDCFDYGAYTVTADLPLTFQEYGLPDWQAIPSTRAAGARLDAAMEAHWTDVGADVASPSLAYQWPPSGGGSSTLLEGLISHLKCDTGLTDDILGGAWGALPAFAGVDADGVVDGCVGAESGSAVSTGGMHVDLPSTLDVSATGVTLAFWAKMSGNFLAGLKTQTGTAGALQAGFSPQLRIGYWSWSTISLNLYGTTPRFDLSQALTPADLRGWHHWAFCADSSGVRVYADGVLVGSSTSSVLSAATIGGLTLLGSSNNPEPYGWGGAGWVDEVCAWSRALSADEVASLYQAGVDGVSYPFSGY